MYNCAQLPGGMPYEGGGGFMGSPSYPMNVMPMLPAYPQPRAPAPPPQPPCASIEHDAKIIADVGAPFLEELTKLRACQTLTAEVNGKIFNLKVGCAKDKKKRKKSRSKRACSKGVIFKCCDCNVPVPPGVCQPCKPKSRSVKAAREEKMHKCLSLCMQMMREMFRRKYEEQMAENEDAIQMVEIPVMVMPGGMGMGGMGGMGMGMGGMGMGMGGMGMGMGGMGMGMGGMGMDMKPPYMGGNFLPPGGVEKGGPCGPCSTKVEKPKVVCKTNRDQQCDESGMAPKTKEKKGKGGKKDKKGKKGGKKGKKKK